MESPNKQKISVSNITSDETINAIPGPRLHALVCDYSTVGSGYRHQQELLICTDREYESIVLNGSYETGDDGVQAGLLTVGDYKYLYGKIKGSEIPDHIYEKMLHGKAFTENDERLVKAIIDRERCIGMNHLG